MRRVICSDASFTDRGSAKVWFFSAASFLKRASCFFVGGLLATFRP
jgi:hypothetical protein